MPDIRKGTKGSKEEGGANTPVTDGGKVKYVKNTGTADPSIGGVPTPHTSDSGLKKVKGQ